MDISIDEKNIFFMLLQLSIIFILTNYSSIILKKYKQPTITGDLIVGIILGPTILGRFFPAIYDFIFPADKVQIAMLDTLGWFGLFLVLLSTGIEVDFSSVWRQRKKALIIAVSDIVIPILISLLFIYMLPGKYFSGEQDRFIVSFFISVIMTISALPISIRALREVGIMKSDVGVLIVSALTINDIIGWIVFTLILSIFSLKIFDWSSAVQIVAYTFIFTFAALTYGKKIVNWLFSKVTGQESDSIQGVLGVLVTTGIIFGLITLEIGIHSLFGFFIAGIVAGDSNYLSKSMRNTIHNFVYSVFISLFFVNIGLKIDFFESFNLFLAIFITFIGIFGRYLGAWIGVLLSKNNRNERNIISIAHTPGGEMHIVVSLVALNFGLLNKDTFVAIIFGAILSSIIIGPWMAYAVKKLNPRNELRIHIFPEIILNAKTKEEVIKKLLESEGFEAWDEKTFHSVIQREEISCTGMINSVAVPQGKVEGIKETHIIFARLKEGINWDSPDGKLSKNIFLILTPEKEDESQLKIIKIISNFIRNCDELEKFDNINEPDEIKGYLFSLFKG